MALYTSLTKIMARYGAIAGVLGALLSFALYYFGRHPFLIPVFFDFRIFIFAIFLLFGLRELRDLHLDGILFFWQGMVGSLFFLLFFAVTSSFTIYVFGTFETGFVTEYVRLFTEQAKTFPEEVIKRIGEEEYTKKLNDLKNVGIGDLARLYFTQSFVIGFFVSIIISVILRRQQKKD